MIPPAAFLYVAERFGMIGGIDAWVAGQAIELIAAQREAGNDLRLEVNLSARRWATPRCGPRSSAAGPHRIDPAG